MDTDKEHKNGWNEYSRLVLAELEKLNNSVEEISDDITELRQEITKIKSIKYDITDIKKDVDKLKTFKTVSTTAWVIVQILFGIAIALFGVFKSGA